MFNNKIDRKEMDIYRVDSIIKENEITRISLDNFQGNAYHTRSVGTTLRKINATLGKHI